MNGDRNLVTRRVGQMLISLENKETPTDEEWDDFLKVLREGRDDFATLKLLVITEGGGPTAAQRKRLEQALGGRTLRVAVVTDSIKVRFIVSSIALLNRFISTFSKAELPRAYEYLGLAAGEQRAAMLAVAEMEPLMLRPKAAARPI
jgi:hypothetical protein